MNFLRLGNRSGSDLRQGIITLPAIFFLLDNPADPAMSVVMNGNDLHDFQFDELIGKIKESGAIEKVLTTANDYLETSRQSLLDFPESIYKSSLLEMIVLSGDV